MNKLEEIGFYTLSDYRAHQSSSNSPLWRCELILTDRCNFKCPYCRGLRSDLKGELSYEEADRVIDLWFSNGLKNVRFSGGEPLLWKGLEGLVEKCHKNGVERIAVSTNGSASLDRYEKLIRTGVNDFSISLDGCCSSVGDRMAGNIPGMWNKVVGNIRSLSAETYVSVGIVFTDQNVNEAREIVYFADSLGVSDIRVIPSAQYNQALLNLSSLDEKFLRKYPILQYRVANIRQHHHVRGIAEKCKTKCGLVLDDMAVAGKYHFPCIIYMREGGDPIGLVSEKMREERESWYQQHLPVEDKICRKNCLDVCQDYNKKFEKYHQH